ncbi:MAG: FAD-binding oxidoreductase [Bacteroidales bacterium]|nr:FAD-binding oxidoreductase [Bacteroidales bacterium]
MKTLQGKHKQYYQAISTFVPKNRIYTDSLRTLAWGTDAGFYRLVPKMVVRAVSEREVSLLLRTAAALDLPVTFRAAGTSLSGQAISDSVLIVAGKYWEDYMVHEGADTITLQPGIIGARVNEILKPYGKIFTPDPASIKSAMVGGIVANNASGMNCGTHANSDKMLVSARIVLADGTVVDTAKPGNSTREKEILEGLAKIRDEIRQDQALTERIKRKYSIKNVTGLNLRPFVAYDDPSEILAHLMVGSEGTLGFISEVTMKTGPLVPFTASAMVYFQDMREACEAVVALKKANLGVYSCEMLDKKSLASVHDNTGEDLTALLIETRAETQTELNHHINDILALLNKYNLYVKPEFQTDPAKTAELWKMRSGVFPAVGGTRPIGTTSLIEDIAFHIDDLPEATMDLAKLIEDCGYDDACIYGHCFEGNYHFVIAQAFDTKKDVEKYSHLIDEIVKLVVDKYDGSLKAEHGTGRNMAPFVEKEWGKEAHDYMLRVKHLLDPKGILNPGVIFNSDPECHVRNMKPLPITDPIIDKCIECGFCEVNCVSCGLTLSARQRIVINREMARLHNSNPKNPDLKELKRGYKYLGDETCAADGLCSTSCPMTINTGDLTHKIRQASKKHNQLSRKIGKWTGEHLATIEDVLRPTLAVANAAHSVIGDAGVDLVGKALHKVGLPLWTPSLPKPYKKPDNLGEKQTTGLKVVYFPSCINQTMGPSHTGGHKTLDPLVNTMVALCNKAGYEVIFPENMQNLCCGMIWESKGHPRIAAIKTSELEAALLKASENGKYPVLCDQSPCLHRMREHIKSMKLYEPVEFIHQFLAPRLDFHPVSEPVAVHITCSTRLMGLGDKLVALAQMCSDNVLVPTEVGCCGFAGDKGFAYPELNRWGLRKLKNQVQAAGVREGFSNSRTCEIGLTTNSGVPYQSIAYLVDQVTTPK